MAVGMLDILMALRSLVMSKAGMVNLWPATSAVPKDRLKLNTSEHLYLSTWGQMRTGWLEALRTLDDEGGMYLVGKGPLLQRNPIA